ncbi:hypothetical protein Agabi119p4_6773 [Agaricus bisporus var. burnettii]|uniref:Uncharacterized protein n=1 Tax=Agaricus bisporus var. burnettii TaxID=192524 RepID=A0A8H7F022_AGABI|nr:hypothetical protein Agabi119p4_6773 [Agaricus bisporus var. burnettii]
MTVDPSSSPPSFLPSPPSPPSPSLPIALLGLYSMKPFLHFYFRNYRHLYTVEDMFTGSFDEEEESRKEAQVMKKVANFCARRHYELIGQKMTLDDYFPVLEEELKPEWI